MVEYSFDKRIVISSILIRFNYPLSMISPMAYLDEKGIVGMAFYYLKYF